MSNFNNNLEDAVILMHHIARIVDNEIGYNSPISREVRQVADRLHTVATATFNDIVSLGTNKNDDCVTIIRTPTNTVENVMKALKS